MIHLQKILPVIIGFICCTLLFYSCNKKELPRLLVLDAVTIQDLPDSVFNAANPPSSIIPTFSVGNRPYDQTYRDFIANNFYDDDGPLSHGNINSRDGYIIDDFSHKVLIENGKYLFMLFEANHIKTDIIGTFHLDFNELRKKHINTNEIQLNDGQSKIVLHVKWIY